jgi:hypothetical protein
MANNITISEEDMNALADKFLECEKNAIAIANSLNNMGTSMLNEVYDGVTKTILRCSFLNLIETSAELANIYEGLRFFATSVKSDFKDVDSYSGDDIEKNVASVESSK